MVIINIDAMKDIGSIDIKDITIGENGTGKG